jgi:predicted negative regulator of RcsB-dependent stress response
MKAVCAQIAGREGGIHQHVRPLVKDLKQTGIADVAASFCDLQEARHRADYDHLADFSKAVALAHVEDAEKAMQTLVKARKRDRDAFFSLLALGARLT